jgi:hypothetical protein
LVDEFKQEVAKQAKVDKLDSLFDLSIIDRFAHRYGKLPREILTERTDDVLPFLFLWKEQEEYRERYASAEKALTPQK